MAVVVVVVLSVAGFAVVTHAVNSDRRASAHRAAAADRGRLAALLDQTSAFNIGLADALRGERAPNAARFAALAGTAATTIGLTQVMWVERITSDQRPAYERRVGSSITELNGNGAVARSSNYLPATYIVGFTFPAGTDMTGVRALAATLQNPASIFAGTATSVETIGSQRGFFVVQGAHFGRGAGSTGFLVVFVPGHWLLSSMAADPNRVAVSLDGALLVGDAGSHVGASMGFAELTREWRVDVGTEPPTGLQAVLPGLALAWPIAIALVVFLVARAMVRRRRAEEEVDDIYDLSLDLLCSIGVDGYLKRVNPAFQRAFGYDEASLLSRPLLDFIYPDDRSSVQAWITRLETTRQAERFESRYVRADGEVRWLEWSARPIVERRRIYASARDTTDARMLIDELEASRRRVVQTADETRRQVERDLHDGAQQRIVQTILMLRRAKDAAEAGNDDVAALIDAAVVNTENANEELRELARGIHPAALSRGGLPSALNQLARRCPVPVDVDLKVTDRLPERVEVTAYYVAAEALTNAAKHAGASSVAMTVEKEGNNLRLCLSDNGIGGADMARGSGLIGLRDRVEAAGGTLSVQSPPGKGTRMSVVLPLTAA